MGLEERNFPLISSSSFFAILYILTKEEYYHTKNKKSKLQNNLIDHDFYLF